jgi:hypothetical protein
MAIRIKNSTRKNVLDKRGFSVTVAHPASSGKEWFDPTLPLKLFPDFPHDEAMKLRKQWIKGFIKPGACNYYIGVGIGNNVFGILGFQRPEYGDYDILLKADTTPSQYANSTDLLLYVLRTKEVKKYLEDYFNREINNCYTMIFSEYPAISRYRKHAKLIAKKINKLEYDIIGYNLGYLFQTGSIPSLNAAKSQYVQHEN